MSPPLPFRRFNMSKRFRHGMCKTTVYKAWLNMKARCNNSNNPQYHSYGGRGVSVCKRWHDFKNFFEDMGAPPKGTSIDRINNNKNYTPKNCRWADVSTQNNNRRDNKWITWRGKTQTLAQWCRQTGVNYQLASQRLLDGWLIEKALSPKLYLAKELTFEGRTQSMSAWSRELGLNSGAVSIRLQRGWSIERALTK